MSPLPRKVVLPEGWFEVVGGKAEEEGGSSMPIRLTHERPRGTLPEGWCVVATDKKRKGRNRVSKAQSLATYGDIIQIADTITVLATMSDRARDVKWNTKSAGQTLTNYLWCADARRHLGSAALGIPRNGGEREGALLLKAVHRRLSTLRRLLPKARLGKPK